MDLITISFILLLFSVPLFYWAFQYRKKVRFLTDLAENMSYSDGEIRETLLHGLRERYSAKETHEEDPLIFERLVAGIVERHLGGAAYVNTGRDGYGADLEVVRYRDEVKELFLGEIVCRDDPVNYEPVALIHSRMVKEKAAGGMVVSAGGFTDEARDYAGGLDIELIDGAKLVDMWIDSLHQDKEQIPALDLKEGLAENV